MLENARRTLGRPSFGSELTDQGGVEREKENGDLGEEEDERLSQITLHLVDVGGVRVEVKVHL